MLPADEHVIIPVHAHDDDAVIAQFFDVKLIAADAAAKRRDERAHFGR